MTWNPLGSQAELDGLLQLFGGFHNGCLREAHLWTEHFVDSDMQMACSPELDTKVRLLVQRQWRNPSAIELYFEQVITFHMRPSPANYDSIIYEATLLHEEEIFYWADTWPWSPANETRNNHTWIAAKKLSWRDASEWMGAKFRYGAKDCEISKPSLVSGSPEPLL